MSPKRAPTARPGRDRFTAESYTVLGKNTHGKQKKNEIELLLKQKFYIILTGGAI